ncbi:LacI family DNA-binding transcriptional regulator [Arcanobacterium ihumii]|uniref:LacI family DNA-binding transcriptional regulator n=1 Tax=Arcanobacterium ihumii TaxID=2138162 RepID=UPI000F51DC6C|nr:LacI family DNA-binding transcriptional regulator [Arcanobacterium ihumii]
MANRIRLADVAKQADVSTATVSRVLNDKNSVALETRQAVLTALDLLGYERPERLRERNGGLIGLVLPELTNPIFPIFAQYLQASMVMYDYTPLLGAHEAGGSTEDAYIDAMLEQHVAGFIFVSGLHADSTASLDRYHRIRARNIPYVTINGHNPNLDAPDFSADDASAVNQALRHLISQGHSRIGLATGQLRFLPAQAKSDAFKDAMKALLPDTSAPQANTLFTVEGGYAAAQELIAQGCTAIICASDVMALGVIRYCHSVGLDVPRDISVVGYDDSPFIAFTHPPLTTLRQPVKAICGAAVTTLLSMINDRTTISNPMKFAPELIVRESTGLAQSK